MAIEEVVNESSDGIVEVVSALGNIGLWLQAVGLVVVAWIIFQIVSWWFSRRRLREIYNIKEDMKRIEDKIDKILKVVK